MTVLISLGRLLLSAVFGVAAVGKLADRGAARSAITDFGAPASATRLLVPGLVLAELSVAAGVLLNATAPAAAVLATALLTLFLVAMVRLLLRGEAPECRCFGAVASGPVGAATVARNAALLAVSAAVAVGAGAHRTLDLQLAGPPWWAYVGGAVVAAQMAFSWQLFRQNGRLLARLDAMEPPASAGGDPPAAASGSRLVHGAPAPGFELAGGHGRPTSLASVLAAGHGAVLLFTDPGCAACEPLKPLIDAWPVGPPPLVLLTREAPEGRDAPASPAVTVLRQKDYEVADAYGVFGLPGAFLLDPDGRVVGGVVQGAAEIIGLLDGVSRPALDVVHVGARA